MTPLLWRHADFMKRWAGQTVSELGSVVTRTAVPLVALVVLGAGPWEMALLVVSASLAVLLVGLFAGAWVDRVRRRPLLIAADGIRAALLFSIPVAYLAGVLRIEQLYVVVFLGGGLVQTRSGRYAYSPAMAGVLRFAPDVLAALFAVSGFGHLVRPAVYQALIPPFLPAPGAIIAISGLAELICSIGLVRRDWWAGPTSAALLVAVFPGNVWFALATTSDRASADLLVVGSWLRLPLQLPLIWAALQSKAGGRRW